MQINLNKIKWCKAIAFALLILLLFSLFSCDVLKNKTSKQSDTTSKEIIETKTYRKGDTVSYIIPKVILKDTTVYTYNRQGSTLKTVYDKSGQIASIDCFASAIEEIKNENREFQQSLLDQKKNKESKVNSQWIWAVCVGFIVIVCFALLLVFIYLKSYRPKT